MRRALEVLGVSLLTAVSALASSSVYGPSSGYTASYSVELAGKRVGRAAFRFQKYDTTFHSRLNVRFNLRRAGQEVRVELRAELAFSATSLTPKRYTLLSLVNGARQAEIRVEMKGDSALAVIEGPGLGKRHISVATKVGTLILDNNFCVDHYQLLVWRFLRSGAESTNVSFLVPQILLRVPNTLEMQLRRQGEQTVAIGDSSFTCWKIAGRSAGGLRLNFLVRKRDGVLLRWEVPAQASVAQLELNADQTDTSFSQVDESEYLNKILDRFFIKSYVDLGDWRRLEYLRLKSRLRIAAFGEPTRDTPWQKFEGHCEVKGNTATYDGVFTVKMVRTKGPGRWIDKRGGRFARELAAEPDVQVDDPLIRRTAREIAGEAATPWEAVERVCHWVAQEIRYKLTGADALTCLRTRQGDCGPKAKLAIAFLRSLGIPARIAGGLLYAGDRWGQHNWVEVYLGEALRWVPVDPTTDETDTFSAAHLTLWEGWAGALGAEPEGARIEVLEFRKAP